MWDLSSAGRASALQAEGHRFEPCRSHFLSILCKDMLMCLNLRRLRSEAESSVGRAADYKSAEIKYADVAQLAEQLICNQQVIGSSPIIGFLKILYFHNGWIPEWPKGTDCKSAAYCFGGSNPPPSI